MIKLKSLMDNSQYNIFKPFIAGCGSGMVSVICGHPLDTIKCHFQTNKSFNISFQNLSKGMVSAVQQSVLINTLMFGISDNIQKYTKSYYISGFMSGLFCALVTNPLEYRKIQYQTLGKCGKSIYKGLCACMVRESISWSIYFGSYHHLHDEYDIHPLLAGGVSGPLSWLSTYPVDVIKTKMQSTTDSVTYKSIMRSIKPSEYSNGLKLCLLRAFLVNSVTFYVYDKMYNSNLLNQNNEGNKTKYKLHTHTYDDARLLFID